MATEITDTNFEQEVLQSAQPVLVDLGRSAVLARLAATGCVLARLVSAAKDSGVVVVVG